MADLLENLLAEAHRVEEDAIYSAKRHFETARLWTWCRWGVGIPTTALAALLASKGVSTAASDALVYLSGAVAVGTALLTFMKPTERVADHTKAGNAYLALRNQARVFRQIDCVEQMTDAKRTERLRQLVSRRDDLNGASPTTPRIAFVLARRRLEAGEASYEIDRPPSP